MSTDTSPFTIEERLVVCVWVHEKQKTSKTYADIRQDFLNRFGKEAPTEANLRIMERKTFQTGSVLDLPRSGRRPSHSEELAERLSVSIDQSPTKSLRKRSAELDVSRTAMLRVMKTEGYKHYKPMAVNELSDSDMNRRKEACQILLEKFKSLVTRRFVLFTDESAIYLSSRARNFYFWGKHNPHYYEELQQHPPHVMIWAGVTSDYVIGPYFFTNGGITGDSYLDMLENWLMPELDKHDLINNVIIQQDGAPAHFSLKVRDFLSSQFPDWIGRSGTLPWTPRSPDLTTCDNWLWSFIKAGVSHVRGTVLMNLK